MVKEIPLTRGKVALVDDQDYDEVMKHKWYARCSHGNWYTQRDVWHPKEKRKERVSMHRQIMQGQYTKERQYTDHINHDGLDNRRCNLRVCSNSENMGNSRGYKRKIPKGIYWDTQRQKWAVQICCQYKKYALGRFENLSDAIKAYNLKAEQLFGEFSLNQRG